MNNITYIYKIRIRARKKIRRLERYKVGILLKMNENILINSY